MSESAARDMRNHGPAIDLEEFERRLRAPEPSRRSDDPLAELARLVGSTNDPFKNMFAVAPGAQHQLPPAQAAVEVASQEVSAETAPQVLRNVADQMRYASGEYPAQTAYQTAPAAPEYAEQHWQQPEAPTQTQPAQWQPEAQADPYYAQREFAPPPPPPGLYEEPAARRSVSRKSVLYMGSALAVVIVGIGATLATSGKMKPEGEQAASAGSRQVRQVSILDKTVGTKPQQSNVVSREEQPVDLTQVQGKPRTGDRVPGDEINRIVALNNPNTAKPVASVPAQGGVAPQAAGYFPEPKKVRTVSVKPDGSLAPAPQQQAARPPSIPSMAATAPAQRPQIAAPAAPSPKPAPAAAAPGPAPKATARANRPPAPEEADAAPVATTRRTEPRPATPATQPQRVAAAAPETPRAVPASSAGGGFAVQLAAPASEAEAKATAARLRQRFSAELGGQSPSIRAASVGDKTVYRVRVGGLSREDATALCSKLQGKGGACFVARN